MILEFISTLIMGAMIALFDALPDLPAMPSSIATAGDWTIDQIGNVVSMLSMLYTPTLLAAIVVVCLALFGFEFLYRQFLWVLKKIPIINIK